MPNDLEIGGYNFWESDASGCAVGLNISVKNNPPPPILGPGKQESLKATIVSPQKKI